jgi:ABC-type uncharacterized transport system permease subunit
MSMSLVWLRLAAALYGASALVAGFATLRGGSRVRLLLQPLLIGAMLFHFVSIVEVLNANHHWMPVAIHELESVIGIVLAGLFCWSLVRYGTVSLGMFVLPLVFLLTLAPAIGPDFGAFFSPRVRNGWVWLHVGFVLAAYSSLIFSFLASLLYLLQEQRLKQKSAGNRYRWLPPLETTDQISYRMLLIGFPCMTLGLVTGSLLAEASIGPSYFSDPKVVLSFGMWLLYVFLLWLRSSTGVRGKRALYYSSVVFVVALTVYAANSFSTVHRFNQPAAFNRQTRTSQP